MIFEDETPKYRKKKLSSTSKSFEKSKHKHEYIMCLLLEQARPYPASYCKICGKIGNVAFGSTERLEDGRYRLLSDEEVFEKYKHLEQIQVETIWQKYVPVNKET